MQAISALPVSDKVIHFTGYAVVACLAVWAEGLARAWKVSAGLVAMGVLLELLQQFVPGRSAEVMDALADLGGVALGFLAGAVLLRRSQSRRRDAQFAGTRR